MTASHDSADTEALRRLNEGYVSAVESSDTGWFEQVLSRDFLNSNPDGSIVDRAGFLAQIARPVGVYGLRAHEVHIRLLGDVAIIHARTSYAKADGSAGSGRYTDIWAKQEGRWLCVAAHVTRC